MNKKVPDPKLENIAIELSKIVGLTTKGIYEKFDEDDESKQLFKHIVFLVLFDVVEMLEETYKENPRGFKIANLLQEDILRQFYKASIFDLDEWNQFIDKNKVYSEIYEQSQGKQLTPTYHVIMQFYKNINKKINSMSMVIYLDLSLCRKLCKEKLFEIESE